MLTTRSLHSTLDRMLTLNRAFDQAFDGKFAATGVWIPAVDIAETRDAYVLYAELPGVDMSNMEIVFEKNVLTIRGSKASPIATKGATELRIFAAERVSGAFERSIRLPEFVDGDAIAADFTNGLLTVTVPKARAAQARKIELKTAPKA